MLNSFVVIDSERKEVRVVEFPEGTNTLKLMQEMVGGYIELGHHIDEYNDIFVNEEGLYKFNNFFIYEGAHQPFAGNGVVAGVNMTGDTIGTTVPLHEIKSKVRFASREEIIRDHL